MSDGPLTGYRVLDLSRFGPGLPSGMVLADLGADVIRVDEVRRTLKVLPHFTQIQHDRIASGVLCQDHPATTGA